MTRILKKIALITGSALLLSGCFGSGSPADTAKEGYLKYQGTDFSIDSPQDWEVITPENFVSDVPKEAALAIKSNIKDEIFTPNIIITKQILTSDVDSRDFAQNSVIKAQSSLIAFSEIAKENINFPVGTGTVPTYLSTFEGKRNSSDPVIRFEQLYIVNNGIAYTVTGAFKSNADKSVENTIRDVLNSFRLY